MLIGCHCGGGSHVMLIVMASVGTMLMLQMTIGVGVGMIVGAFEGCILYHALWNYFL